MIECVTRFIDATDNLICQEMLNSSLSPITRESIGLTEKQERVDTIPDTIPDKSPDKIPDKRPDKRPDKSPDKIPDKRPDKSPDNTLRNPARVSR